ncbi:acyl-CoA synthetase [Minwuia sp.]|uniref:acyl-CoA synthetase n=1 Tax=Minwuia sp. TaxID=2493630 RepID=UPI003A927A4B
MQPGTIISGDRTSTAEERLDNAMRVARALNDAGVGTDDCVAIYLRNDFPFFETSAACTLLGAYATPINWHYTAEEASFILRDCDAKVLVIHSDLLKPILGAVPDGVTIVAVPTPPEIAAAYGATVPDGLPDGVIAYDDFKADKDPWTDAPPASRGTMIYTSGTTGNPKGVRREPMDEEAQARQAMQIQDGFGIPVDASGVRTVMTGPMYHSAPNAYGLGAARAGAAIYLEARFDAEELLQIIDEHRITHMHVVPTMFVRLLRLPDDVKAKYDTSSLQYVIHGAAPCPPEAKRQMIDWWGPVIYEYYGSTENGIVTIVTPDMAINKTGTVGKPIAENQIRILDDDKKDLPPGEIGEVYIWRPHRTDFTYHKRDAARREMDVDGFLTNGDMGWLDEDGCLFLADRKNDMVISGGVNIYPAEIEKALAGMPGVKDCAVFGIPNAEFGEALAAHIEVADPSIGPEDVKRYLSDHVAKYKIPREIVFADSLPREDSGKIFKRKLREPYWAGMPRRI